MAWIWVYLKACFKVEWAGRAKDYFFNDVLKLSSGPGELGGLSIPVVIGVILTWIMIYYILRNGVKNVGKVVMLTVPLPVVLLGILAIRALTLPGAVDGLNYFLTPDFSRLLDWEVWAAAYSQIFFTLSLGFGIMIAYASYRPKDAEITNSAMITVLANSGISFLAGLAVFGTLGYMANVQGVAVDQVVTHGVGLAFVVYPEAINLLPGGSIVAGLFGLVFFLMLFTLGIDSAFSLVEGAIAAIEDKWGWTRKKITFWTCTICCIIGIFFATKAGLFWLDIVDHWVTNFGLIIAGLLELFAVGWVFKAISLREFFNPISEYKFGSWWDICIKFLSPLVLIWLLINQFITEIKIPYEGYGTTYLWIGGWCVIIFMAVLSYILGKSKSQVVSVDRGESI